MSEIPSSEQPELSPDPEVVAHSDGVEDEESPCGTFQNACSIQWADQ